MSDAPRSPRDDGPTEIVEGAGGEMIERLSGGTATVLLVWLIGVGSFSTLLAAWAWIWAFTGERLGLGALFGGFGFYTALAGAAGPCVLWLAGRAQGHSLAWFAWTAARISLVMVAVVAALVVGATLVMAAAVPGPGVIPAAVAMVIGAVLISQVWAVATWAADRWIARARIDDTEDEGGAQTS